MTEAVISHETFSRRIWRKTWQGVGVKLGFAWVALLVLMGVFAPFLANSMPLLMSKGGEISAPVLHYLNIEDVVVLAMFALAVVLALVSLSAGKRVLLFVLGTLIAALLANLWVKAPAVMIYDEFRTPAYADVDWRIMPPVPYAPQDYLRDYQEHGLEQPLAATDGRFHLMGTEENGADVFSRMIHASRIALSIGLIATGIALVIGVILGGLMGYLSGVVDMLGMRLVEIFESIPTLFLLLTFVAFFGRSLYMMMVIIGVTSWSGYARYIRAEFLKLRRQEYVQAAIASGLPLSSILFRHMLPNGVAPLLVGVSFGVASAILAEATLSFLGLGLVGEPSWGQMLDQAVKSSMFNWWMAAFPGGAIFFTVFAYNLIGEAFRDAIDPQLSRNAGVKA
ncbi:MAG: ABC transporter permease [Thiothrix sp.]|uniref:ABC transporter permease n=1 Tax=Thiothrix sp. TaxID=1032 RepID=UPI00260A6E06|nr:ABC transporter permease [Thiothrix sp.]MDD5393993.1 ABC transporter permease [Thiothrix sp.]